MASPSSYSRFLLEGGGGFTLNRIEGQMYEKWVYNYIQPASTIKSEPHSFLYKMENKTFYVKYLNYQPVPVDTAYGRGPQGAHPLLTVGHLIAAYKRTVAPRFDSTPTDELTLHLNENGEAFEADQILSAILGGGTAKTPLVIKSQKDTVLQEPSPVPSERPVTPEDKKHIEMLMHYIFKAEAGGCVTILDHETAVTYAHGSHSSWKLEDTIQIFSILPERPAPIMVSVAEIHTERDFILLRSKTKLCDQRLKMEPPHQKSKYIQIGLSGKDAAPIVYHGVIASDKFDDNKGFFLGTVGAAPGESGGGVFCTNWLGLYGICTAAVTRKVPTHESVSKQLKQVNLNASYPHFSYICPSMRFNVKPPPPSKRKREYEEGDAIVLD